MCSVYVMIAVLALIHNLTRKPGVVFIFAELLLERVCCG